LFFYHRSENYERDSEAMNKTNAYFIQARQNGKTERERKVIFEITGDGLTAEEVGRIRQVIRHLNYKRGRRKAPRLFYRYNFNQRKEI
jgi:hypothetical protein